MSSATPRRSECAIAGSLDIFGDRWSLLIVRDLLFGDLAASSERIPTNTLADRLRKLEEAGIVSRERYSDRPPRHTYRLTPRGRALAPVLDALASWGTTHLPGTRRLNAPETPTPHGRTAGG